MEARKVGDLFFSIQGFGAWAIGGDYKYGWGPSDDTDAVTAIHSAADLGINWIDTAAVYGYGHSEKIVGRALKQKPGSMYVASKCGLLHNAEDELTKCLKPESIEREIDASLSRLGVSTIDLYQCHWPDNETPIEVIWESMARLVQKGKVRQIGLSNFCADDIRQASTIFPVASIQAPYNILRPEVETEIFPTCRTFNIGFLGYSPMQSGLLSGEFKREKLSPRDWRLRKAQWYCEPKLSQHLRFVSLLKPIAKKYNATVGQLVIAWTLRDRVVSSSIVGARNQLQVISNVRAAAIKIEPKDIQTIAEIKRSNYAE